MITRTAPTRTATIYVAGDAASARSICRAACNSIGLCVTVTDCDYVYKGGAESGVAVGLVNYPKYPSEPNELRRKARELAELLRVGLYQESVMIREDDETTLITERVF